MAKHVWLQSAGEKCGGVRCKTEGRRGIKKIPGAAVDAAADGAAAGTFVESTGEAIVYVCGVGRSPFVDGFGRTSML